MNVGDVATATGMSVKTLHYYEEIGLVVPKRQDNGYRVYSEIDVHKLNFIHRARGLGFSVDACRTLLSLYEDKQRASADVKAIANEHLEEIEIKIEELRSLRNTLKHLIDHCKGDHRPDCPIIDGLAGEEKDMMH
ncbi:MAG: Cu(I)-responsive transcriptional regulator [Rhodospirillales bacterium]|tara:strand:- start:174 stop:578 length:405 start_codon:yes stop_codon:yes gene_type:complete